MRSPTPSSPAASADGNARARALYETALDLLDLPEARPETGDRRPVPAQPGLGVAAQHGRSGLAKIHRGLNIAGADSPGSGDRGVLPSQYRYGVLVERAKNLVSTAQQVEAAYLSALEQRDAKAYDELRARHDLEVAGAAVTTQAPSSPKPTPACGWPSCSASGRRCRRTTSPS